MAESKLLDIRCLGGMHHACNFQHRGTWCSFIVHMLAENPALLKLELYKVWQNVYASMLSYLGQMWKVKH